MLSIILRLPLKGRKPRPHGTKPADLHVALGMLVQLEAAGASFPSTVGLIASLQKLATGQGIHRGLGEEDDKNGEEKRTSFPFFFFNEHSILFVHSLYRMFARFFFPISRCICLPSPTADVPPPISSVSKSETATLLRLAAQLCAPDPNAPLQAGSAAAAAAASAGPEPLTAEEQEPFAIALANTGGLSSAERAIARMSALAVAQYRFPNYEALLDALKIRIPTA